MPAERPTPRRRTLRFALLLLPAVVGCFEADISRQPRDRSPLPAPTWDWTPDRGEVAEFPIPPGSRWLPDAQQRLSAEVAAGAPSGSTPLAAVYENDSPGSELEAFYRKVLGSEPERPPTGGVLFAEVGSFPRVLLRTTGGTTRIELTKVLPPGVSPPQRPVSSASDAAASR